MSNPPNYRDLITDYLSLCRSHHTTLNNIISTMSIWECDEEEDNEEMRKVLQLLY